MGIPTWEYYLLSVSHINNAGQYWPTVESLGVAGWELCSSSDVNFIFKRPKGELKGAIPPPPEPVRQHSLLPEIMKPVRVSLKTPLPNTVPDGIVVVEPSSVVPNTVKEGEADASSSDV
jgi:hypothetical protein